MLSFDVNTNLSMVKFSLVSESKFFTTKQNKSRQNKTINKKVVTKTKCVFTLWLLINRKIKNKTFNSVGRAQDSNSAYVTWLGPNH